MKTNKIPTADEFLQSKQYDWAEDINTTECMIEFAKLHVEAALKKASMKAQLNVFTKGTYEGVNWHILKDGDSYCTMEESLMSKIDKKSILNSYPLSNIK